MAIAPVVASSTPDLHTHTATRPPETTRDHSFEARWAAWIARGAARDAARRRQFQLAIPVLLVALFAAVWLYLL